MPPLPLMAPRTALSGRAVARTQTGGWGGPYSVTPGVHLFTDWRWVQPGHVRWVDAAGANAPLGGDGPFVDAQPVPNNVPRGLHLEAQPASLLGPLLGHTKPWEASGVMPAQMYREGGRYRLWYMSGDGMDHNLCYAESTDGVAWGKPSLGLVEWEGSRDNNIVFGGHLAAATGIHGPGVFLDPSCSNAERYKLIFIGRPRGPAGEAACRQLLERFKRERPADIDPNVADPKRFTALYGAVSSDGLRWTMLPEPLVLHQSDTANVAYFDQQLERYVWYGRCNWWYGRRCIGRSETTDFRRFPTPELVAWPNTDVLASDDWYTNCKTVYPGSPTEHLLFPQLYRRAEDRFEVELFSSPDGIHWSRVPGGPVISPGPPGTWNGEWIGTAPSLLPLEDNRVGLPFHGLRYPHKFPRRADVLWAQLGLATWPAGRLSAIVASGEGAFVTPQLEVVGRMLRLNTQVRRAGRLGVQVEAPRRAPAGGQQGAELPVLPGRGIDDCDPIYGDHLAHTVTWHGESDLGHAGGEPIVLRFQLRAAKLFAFELV